MDVESRPRPIVEVGSAELLRQPGRTSTSFRQSTSGVEFNIVDGNVRDVVSMILRDVLGVNFTIDSDVTGTMTLHTKGEIPVTDLPAILDAVLRLNGATLVQADSLFKVVPLSKAHEVGALPTITTGRDVPKRGFNILIAPIRFATSSHLKQILEPFSSGSTVLADHSRNVLILAGSTDQLNTLSALIDTFDVDWLAGRSFGLYPLLFAEAGQMVRELEAIFALNDSETFTKMIRFIPINRMNAVLSISSEPVYLERVEKWIERLDHVSHPGGDRIFVYKLEHTDAEAVAKSLGSILRPTRRGGVPSLAAVVDSTDTAEGNELLDPADFRYTDMDGAIQGKQGLAIVADTNRNALLISASRSDFDSISRVLQELDAAPPQVLIEATIVEVLLNDDLRYGVEWFFRFGSNEARLSPELGSVEPRFPGFSGILSSADSMKVVLNALEEVSDVNVISSPSVLVLENEAAFIQVGDQVPVAIQSAVLVSDPTAPIVNTIRQQNTGVILSVKPRISGDGLVTMKITGETSDAVPTRTSQIDSPTIRQRQVSSTVAIQSGDTVVLGGLIRESSESGRRGVPILSGIPVIGALFGNSARSTIRTEVLVLITPTVITGRDAAREITEELRRRLRRGARLE